MDSRQTTGHAQAPRPEPLCWRRHDWRGNDLGTVSRSGIFVWGRAFIQSARFRSEPGGPKDAASAQDHDALDGRFGGARQSFAAGKPGPFFRAGFFERPTAVEGNESDAANSEGPLRDNRCAGVESFATVGRRARFAFSQVFLAKFG